MNNIVKNPSIILLVLAVVVTVGFLVYKNASGDLNESTGLLQGSQHTIELSDKGFSPEEIKIHKGDTVIFKTTRSGYFWPASDLHPTHTLYPEFDPKEPIGPKEEWSFKFEKTGEWKYHDHLAPYFKGRIIVVGETASSKREDNCKNNEHSQDCWQDKLLAELERNGLDKTFDLLAKLYAEEPSFSQRCHYLSHNIGIAAYKHYLKEENSVLTPKAAYCANGFYHGFMEAFLTASRDLVKAKSFCTHVGDELEKEAPDAELQCYHGIGHGAIEASLASGGIGKKEEEMIKPAIKICETVSSSDEELYRCNSGIFNAIANFYVTGEFGLKVNNSSPMWLCDGQPDEYKESCYGNMNTVLVWLAEGDFSKAASFIEKIPEEKYKVSAMRYLTNMYTLSYARGGYERAINACRAVNKSLSAPCIEGFAHGFLEQGIPGKEYVEALDFCKSNYLNSAEKEICFKYTLNLGGWYPKEKVSEICEGVDKEYQKYCIIP